MATEWSEDIAIADLSDEPSLSDELGSLVERVRKAGAGKTPHVVLNFENVSYVNSSNIAQLLELNKALRQAGRSLCLCRVSPEVRSVLHTTGLDRIFQFAPDPMTALAGLQLEDADEEPGDGR